MKSDRIARVNRLIQTTLADLLSQVKDPRVTAATVLSVMAVRTSPDLRHAKVYLAISGTPEDRQAVLAGLERAQGFLRGELGRSIRLRYSPELHFFLDETIESAARIDEILHELGSEGGSGGHPDARTIDQAQDPGAGQPDTAEAAREQGSGERGDLAGQQGDEGLCGGE